MKSSNVELRAVRDAGAKAARAVLHGAGLPDWTEHVEAAVLAGADAVEIGIPFSDPMMDGR